MKKIIFLIISVCLWAYEAKVKEFDIYKIKSSVSGEVIESNKNLETKTVKNALIVRIDDKQNKIDIKNLQTQLKILDKEIANQSAIVARKKRVYEKYKTLKTKSRNEKDLKFYDYISSYNQLLNLQSQFNTTKANIEKLQDTINKKTVKVSGYVYKIYVNKGDHVAPGVLIADVYDISKQKLTIYVPVNEIDLIKNKKVYINDKKSDFKIYKIWNVPDTKYITSYKVELIGKGLKFGNVVKVELK